VGDHVDDVGEGEVAEEIGLHSVGFLFAGSGVINLEGVDLIVLAGEVDTG
jgi:hypothetical protein